MRHYYGVKFFNKSIKSFVLFSQLSQPAEETFFLQFLNNMDKTCNNIFKFFQLGPLVGGFLYFNCEYDILKKYVNEIILPNFMILNRVSNPPETGFN